MINHLGTTSEEPIKHTTVSIDLLTRWVKTFEENNHCDGYFQKFHQSTSNFSWNAKIQEFLEAKLYIQIQIENHEVTWRIIIFQIH